MKKLITIILILSLIPLTVAHAIDRSRIVGYWYTFIDGDYNRAYGIRCGNSQK